MTLSACGASSGTNLDLFKDDIAANEAPLNLGTLNSHPVILAHDDDYGEQVELYAHVDLDTTLLRQRVGNVGDDYIIFFIEKGEGEYANGGVVFTFESEINQAQNFVDSSQRNQMNTQPLSRRIIKIPNQVLSQN